MTKNVIVSSKDLTPIDRGNYKLYPIIWFENRKNDYVGICCYSKKVYCRVKLKHFHPISPPFIIRNVIITNDGECEECKRCLAVSCRLNKTTASSFAMAWKLKKIKKEEWDKATKEWDRFPCENIIALTRQELH